LKKERRSAAAAAAGSARAEKFIVDRRTQMVAGCCLEKQKAYSQSDAPLSVFSEILAAHWEFIEEFMAFVNLYFFIYQIRLLCSGFIRIWGLIIYDKSLYLLNSAQILLNCDNPYLGGNFTLFNRKHTF
jgi:hypothetical protein